MIRCRNADYLSRPLRLAPHGGVGADRGAAARSARSSGDDATPSIDRTLAKLEAAAGDGARGGAGRPPRCRRRTRPGGTRETRPGPSTRAGRSASTTTCRPGRVDRAGGRPDAAAQRRGQRLPRGVVPLRRGAATVPVDRISSAEVLDYRRRSTPMPRRPGTSPRDSSALAGRPAGDRAPGARGALGGRVLPDGDGRGGGPTAGSGSPAGGDPEWLVRLMLRLGSTPRWRAHGPRRAGPVLGTIGLANYR